MKDTNFNSITLFISSVISILALAMILNGFQKIENLNKEIELLERRLYIVEYNVKRHDRVINDYPDDDINTYDNKLENLYEGNIENK